MRNRRTSIVAALAAAGACVLVVASFFVFRSRPAPAGPAAKPLTPVVQRAVVLRDGKAWQAHWSRPHGSDGTTFTPGTGRRMTFARGPVWVVLAYG